jgi:hypothetical protein
VGKGLLFYIGCFLWISLDVEGFVQITAGVLFFPRILDQTG